MERKGEGGVGVVGREGYVGVCVHTSPQVEIELSHKLRLLREGI